MDKKNYTESSQIQTASSVYNTSKLIESDKDVQSYIYQQITEFEQYVTPETLVLVVARDPYEGFEDEQPDQDRNSEVLYKIAIILKENEATIEAEATNTSIYDAIKQAKEQLINKLIEIQNEVESPQERLQAIQQASSNDQIH